MGAHARTRCERDEIRSPGKSLKKKREKEKRVVEGAIDGDGVCIANNIVSRLLALVPVPSVLDRLTGP